jgi:hypothetical protein
VPVTLRSRDPATAEPATKVPDSWPAEELEAVDRCPLCGCADRILLHRDLTDGVFLCTG